MWVYKAPSVCVKPLGPCGTFLYRGLANEKNQKDQNVCMYVCMYETHRALQSMQELHEGPSVFAKSLGDLWNLLCKGAFWNTQRLYKVLSARSKDIEDLKASVCVGNLINHQTMSVWKKTKIYVHVYETPRNFVKHSAALWIPTVQMLYTHTYTHKQISGFFLLKFSCSQDISVNNYFRKK